jgi:hypothetical protein
VHGAPRPVAEVGRRRLATITASMASTATAPRPIHSGSYFDVPGTKVLVPPVVVLLVVVPLRPVPTVLATTAGGSFSDVVVVVALAAQVATVVRLAKLLSATVPTIVPSASHTLAIRARRKPRRWTREGRKVTRSWSRSRL